MSQYGFSSDARAWQSYSTRLRRMPSSYSPAGLWHFDGDGVDAANGATMTTAGTLSCVTAEKGFKTWWSSQIFRAGTSAAASANLRLLGDMSIVMTVMIPHVDTYDPALHYALVTMCGTTVNSANFNILYSLSLIGRRLKWWQESGAGVDATWTSDYLPPRQQWISFAATREAGVVTLWENAVSQGSSTALTPPTGGSSASLYLASGPKDPGASRYLDMYCAGLGVYPAALTQPQLAAIATEVLG